MNKEEIIKEVAKIKKQEKNLDIKISLDPNDLYPERLDCIWYGGFIGSISYKDYEISIHATGDVRARLYKNGKEIAFVKDRGENGRFYDEFNSFISSDKELYDAFTNNSSDKGICLELDNNNWLEFRVYNIKTASYLDFAIFSNIIDTNNVLEAFNNIKDYIEMINDYERNEYINFQKQIIQIDTEEAKYLQDLLDATDIDFNKKKIAEDSTIETFTANFSNGFFADIKVCSGQNNCFVDPVLFTENGSQICVLEPEGELLGYYTFTVNDINYVVEVITEIEEGSDESYNNHIDSIVKNIYGEKL